MACGMQRLALSDSFLRTMFLSALLFILTEPSARAQHNHSIPGYTDPEQLAITVLGGCGPNAQKARPLDLKPLAAEFFPQYTLKFTAADPVDRQGACYLLIPRTGPIVDIGDTWGTDNHLSPYLFKNDQLDRFLDSQKVAIRNGQEAVRFAQLIRGIELGPYAVGSQDVALANRYDGGWRVAFRYVGPERDVAPTTYQLDVSGGLLRALRQIR
jgi:hypothetical protein